MKTLQGIAQSELLKETAGGPLMYLPVNSCSTLAGRFLCGTLVQKAAEDAMV